MRSRKTYAIAMCGPSLSEIDQIMSAMLSAQFTGSPADWDLAVATHTSLIAQADGYAVQHAATGLPGSMPWMRKANGPSPLKIGAQLPAQPLVSYGLGIVFLPTAAQDDAATIRFLDDIARTLPSVKNRALRAILFVPTHALSLLPRVSPPIDAVEAWERAKSGQPPCASPVELAANPAHWAAPLAAFDQRLSHKLSRLRAHVTSQGVATAVLPICPTGLCLATGTAAHTDSSQPFNLRPLAQVLSHPQPETILNTLTGALAA